MSKVTIQILLSSGLRKEHQTRVKSKEGKCGNYRGRTDDLFVLPDKGEYRMWRGDFLIQFLFYFYKIHLYDYYKFISSRQREGVKLKLTLDMEFVS